MKIAIIGAGFTGLSAAYQLIKKGHEVTIFEKDPQPGGLAIGYQEKGWEWTLETFYHHWFTSDKAIFNLAKELDFPILIRRPKTSHLIDRKILQLDSPFTLLTFQKLSIHERLQMAVALGLLRFNPFWKPLEKYTATAYLQKTVGEKAYKILWEPLLVGKFGKYANKISLAWFWGRFAKRTTQLAYPEGGFLRFAKRITEAIKQNGGDIYYATEIIKVHSNDKPQITYKKTGKLKTETYDKIIVTLPSFAFLNLAPQLPETYKKSLMQLKGLGAIVIVMRLKKPFLTNGTYWLSICDTKAPLLALVEHTNFMDSKHYNNEHLVYLGHYLPQDHQYFTMNEEALMKKFDPFLKKLNPDYQKTLISIKKFSVPFAQPIIPINYSKMLPPFETPLKNIYLANMQQVYPWDRGTNYAVELGEKIAMLLMNKQ
ncbi:MAG TPA: NAD(P)/FAD-dependent oxidoreductase [Candidatus Sulfotelmatobacter sp.]|jgi:protoporphyrinogen oxidase|nr:NAD(P)/FAD-dependent oxidoreductase [Candidatus Sulfotelmatobacter sp.]